MPQSLDPRFDVLPAVHISSPDQGQDRERRWLRKADAIAGRAFPSWETTEAHLEAWTREVADLRQHGTTGEPPIDTNGPNY